MDSSGSKTGEIFVQPGESHLVDSATVLKTVLGSCVGVTFRVARLGVGALCHPMLPHLPLKTHGRLEQADKLRYVDFAIRDLAVKFDALGVSRSEIEVKVFGGADVLPATQSASRPTVGRLNTEAAMRILSDEGFSVAISSTGGTQGIQIQFHTGTGEVLLRRFARNKGNHAPRTRHAGDAANAMPGEHRGRRAE